jgi:hypothetical protein
MYFLERDRERGGKGRERGAVRETGRGGVERGERKRERGDRIWGEGEREREDNFSEKLLLRFCFVSPSLREKTHNLLFPRFQEKTYSKRGKILIGRSC